MHTMSIHHGLHIQMQQLIQWKLRLNDECFTDLMKECLSQNENIDASIHTGYDVFRGSHMNNFIENWKPKN